MSTRRIFALTLAASSAAAGVQIALCENGMSRTNAAAAAMPAATFRDATVTYGPDAEPFARAPRSSTASIHAGSPADRPLARSGRFGSVI